MAAAAAPPVHYIFVVNKSGGLIYSRALGAELAGPGASPARLDTNDAMRLASIWHSLHAIAAQLSPVAGCQGIELLEASTFDLHCFQALTGTKFFVTVPPKTAGTEAFLRTVYTLYADYVLKNPFYEVEMPIRCELFDVALLNAAKKL